MELLRFTSFYWVLLFFFRVLLDFLCFYLVLLGFTGFYWVLLGFTGFYWVLLVFSWMDVSFLIICGWLEFVSELHSSSGFSRVSVLIVFCLK